MKINVYCYRCGSSLDVIEDYAEGYPFSGIVLKVEPCADCSKDDVEPDFVELLNSEVKWHENNIVQDENTEKQDAFINGIRQAIFLIVKAKRGLTSRAADECPTCAGLGFVNDNRGRRGVDCSDCNGSGIRR